MKFNFILVIFYQLYKKITICNCLHDPCFFSIFKRRRQNMYALSKIVS